MIMKNSEQKYNKTEHLNYDKSSDNNGKDGILMYAIERKTSEFYITNLM